MRGPAMDEFVARMNIKHLTNILVSEKIDETKRAIIVKISVEEEKKLVTLLKTNEEKRYSG
jgi:hypothetical protein